MALAVGFLISVLANSIVFAKWGLPFLQVASTSDVVNSGLQLSWAVSVCILAAALGWRAQIVVQRVKPRRRRWVNIGVSILISAVGLGGACWSISLIFRTPDTPRLDAWLIAYSFLAFAAGFGLTRDHLRSRERDPDLGRVGRWIQDILSIIAVVGLAVLMATMTVVMTSGFMEGEYQVSGVELPAACENRVLWMGERSIVVRCAANVRPVVLVGPDNVILTPIPKDRLKRQGLKFGVSKS